jgi:hypothetical protein
LLGGFFFQSTTDPATLVPGDFAYDVIGGVSGMQLSVPDQSKAGRLLAISLVGLLAFGWHGRRTA